MSENILMCFRAELDKTDAIFSWKNEIEDWKLSKVNKEPLVEHTINISLSPLYKNWIPHLGSFRLQYIFLVKCLPLGGCCQG